MSFVVEGIPHKLDAPSEYDHPQFGKITSMWFRVVSPDLPKPTGTTFEETFEACGDLVPAVQAAAEAGTVVKMRCRLQAFVSRKSGKPWAKICVQELLP